jgi:hypothetical protein
MTWAAASTWVMGASGEEVAHRRALSFSGRRPAEALIGGGARLGGSTDTEVAGGVAFGDLMSKP